MKVEVLKTKPVVTGDSLFQILDQNLPKLAENCILVITSKIISICENRVVKINSGITREKLVEQEADMYIDAKHNQYGFHIAIKDSALVASAGIDESNGNGYYILWPKYPYKTAARIWKYLTQKHQIKNFGVLISDSRLTPLRWGTIGISVAHCGFRALNDYRNMPDIFGKKLKVTQASIRDGLAAAAVVVMGEGSEQTPLALVTNVPFVKFQSHPPTEKEIRSLNIKIDEDVFAPFLRSALWQKGKIDL